MPQFHQLNGLTAYSFACGYIQRAQLKRPLPHKVVDLYRDSACWQVKAYDYGLDNDGQGRLSWDSFDSLTAARIRWDEKVREVFKDELEALRGDGRYTYTREFHGEAEQSWITRFCGEWVGKSETRVQARLNAYQHWQQHVLAPAAPVA